MLSKVENDKMIKQRNKEIEKGKKKIKKLTDQYRIFEEQKMNRACYEAGLSCDSIGRMICRMTPNIKESDHEWMKRVYVTYRLNFDSTISNEEHFRIFFEIYQKEREESRGEELDTTVKRYIPYG